MHAGNNSSSAQACGSLSMRTADFQIGKACCDSDSGLCTHDES
jgi:hypothetical protein